MSDSSHSVSASSDDSHSDSPIGRPASDEARDAVLATDTPGGYLVLHSAGRWSDIFRLSAPAQVILGRSSSNDIAIRSEKASRQHARVWSTTEGWMIEDLGSRNGTFVAGRLIDEPVLLSEGDMIQVAGFSIQFVSQLQSAAGPVAAADPAGATEDHLTLAMEAVSITDRRSHSGYLHPPDYPSGRSGGFSSAMSSTKSTDQARGTLLQLAFELAGAESASQAIDAAMDCLVENVAVRSAGAYLVDPKSRKSGAPQLSADSLVLIATRQRNRTSGGGGTYRRPADAAIESVIGAEGQAILARNVAGDRTLATENSHGEIDVVSMILAPVRDRERSLLGMVHLLTADQETVLGNADLEFVLAVAEILAESLRNLRVRGMLDRSLRRSQRHIKVLKEQLGDRVQIVGQSDAVREIIEQVSLAAPTAATVLIRGESGVGKELVASAIHHASARAAGPLVCLNCAALSPSLLESELFGHEKGAFTGATERKLGKFEAADGGTLMLDEIGEMDPEIQAKFLRVLEGHPFERVGGQSPIKVDVRVVAATNRDLQQMVIEGKFRQDLFYRLHVVEVVVPPLRKRGADILLLAEHFVKQFNEQMGRRITTITEDAQQMLLDYSWPGNIRELRNVIERSVVLNAGTTIEAKHLLLTPAASGAASGGKTAGAQTPVEISLAELERTHIERVLRHTDGNKSRAATILGIERSTLDRKLKRFAKDDR